MTKRNVRKGRKETGIRTTASGTFARAVQEQAVNTERALDTLVSIRLKEAERDLILKLPIHERVAESAQ